MKSYLSTIRLVKIKSRSKDQFLKRVSKSTFVRTTTSLTKFEISSRISSTRQGFLSRMHLNNYNRFSIAKTMPAQMEPQQKPVVYINTWVNC